MSKSCNQSPTRRAPTWMTGFAFVVAGLMTGCGADSTEDAHTGPDGSGGSDNAGGAGNTAGTDNTGGDGQTLVGNGPDGDPPHFAIGAEPCEDFETEYDGDEYCIKAPDPSLGFQLHYGPKDFSDPEEIEKYLLYPGEETTDCYFMKTPNDKDVFLAEYHGRMRPGSHHMITYTQLVEHEDSTGPQVCNQDQTSRFLLGAQEKVVDVFPQDNAPEHEGYAMKVGANLQAAVQLHYINTGSKPILRESWINGVYMDEADVKTLVEPIFWLGGLNMAVKPHSTEVIKGTCTAPDKVDELRLINVTGHYHAHTVRFSAWYTPAGSSERTLIYESYTYNDPGWARFDTINKNQAPNPETGTPGGLWDGELAIAPGDRIDWECEVNNTTDGVLEFDDGAYTAEMCNMFGTYAPSMGHPWSCYNW